MDVFVQYTLYLHILVGSIALFSGAVALFSAKGKAWHISAGRLYFWAMTVVFATGIFIAGYRYNRFLFLIAFLSYYSVFSGTRALKLKKLHKDQRPLWFDWAAGAANTVANAFFIVLGIYYAADNGFLSGGVLLSVGFGIGGLALSYTNLKPLIFRPKQPYHWYMSHMGNMMGGYIATLTAFLSTMVTRYELMNPFFAFALPSLIGIPLMNYWLNREEKKIAKVDSKI